jgi:dynactin-4
MPTFNPYTYIQCPCTDHTPPTYQLPQFNAKSESSNPTPTDPSKENDEDEEEEQTFDPRAPRANFSLYPLEHLFYCEDCHQIRCPKCVLDEIVTWYCPNCLFEVPSSTVKSEGNRLVFPADQMHCTVFMGSTSNSV